MESHKRTLSKTISWRLIAMVITAILAGLLAHNVKVGLTIGVADTLVKFFAYYFHERAWARVSGGYLKGPEGHGDRI